ncbi:hypothetical protein BC939DRAFT_501487 [Gamsiella multidivaricata]|uniref:uncharacterized protein n=1 Tax=Gamsiella multidivaricata TaxID=101098 RepID=UPI00221FAD79|nr:uncharacterized protein BC939DRAFT_501487 [Gamsiella multidivaricata]KAI7827155.1 hypothetical protein BC939DRAFT_501487 [Gamsiella multidivaricata]
MYLHTLTLNIGSSLHSFVLDTGNGSSLRALDHSDDQELAKSLHRMERPTLPLWMKKEIAKYALQPDALEEALSHGWAHFSIDHSNDPDVPAPDALKKFQFRLYSTILTIWTLYRDHTEDLQQEQSEAFYALRVWNALVDGLLKNVPDIKILRGERCSQSSSVRKNEDRDLESKKALGRRIDGIFISRKSKLEFGVIEGNREREGATGTKTLMDTRKLAKLLKDMMNHIFQASLKLDQLSTKIEMVGMLQSSLRVDFVSLDQIQGRFSLQFHPLRRTNAFSRFYYW